MNWKVRFVDYPSQFKKMEKEIMDTIKTTLSNGDLILRQQLRDFEKNFAAFVGVKYAVGVSNCTDALRLALIATGVGYGDEVITVSHTFVATAAAIHHVGAMPVLVDIDDDHNIDVDLIEQAITPRTKVIMPVHLNGRVCNMARMVSIAEKHGILIIEDAAQALGASFNDIKVGTFGLAGCFSFYPAKLLGAFGDGGAVVTNSLEIAQKIKALRDHGRMKDGNISGWAFNCRLDNLQAALLDLKLKQLPEWIKRRREIALLYYAKLSQVTEVRLPPPPAFHGSYYDSFQNYEIEAQDRDRLVSYLKENGVEILIPWGGRAVHQFEELQLSGFHLPRTERLFREVLMLPLTTELSNEQIDYVANTIHNFYQLKNVKSTPVSV